VLHVSIAQRGQICGKTQIFAPAGIAVERAAIPAEQKNEL